jgi:hypothetical protein
LGSIEIDDRTHAMVRFAARVAGTTEAVVVARAVHAYCEVLPADDGDVAWTAVAVVARYRGRRVEGLFLPATRRLTVTTEPLAGKHFKSPSGAATAVVRALNPERGTADTNGWMFWRLDNGDQLESLR